MVSQHKPNKFLAFTLFIRTSLKPSDMLPIELLNNVFHIIQYSGAGVSLVLNTFLIFLILTRSPKSLGMYKYLMIYIAVFEAFYSVLNVITEPSVLSYRAAFIVYRDSKNSILNREEGFHLIIFYCGCFGFSLALFGVHFIYRYSTVDNAFREQYLSGRKVYILFMMPILYGTWWTAACQIFGHPTNKTSDYIRDGLLNNYDLNLKDISYGVLLFYPLDEHKKPKADINSFIFISCLWFMIISSLSCIIYFGINCYITLTKGLENSNLESSFAKSLQQELFQALVCQTMIPVILMYIPIGVLFLLPMLNIDAGFASSFVVATIPLYPATDPLPTMFIIKDYRKAIFRRTCCLAKYYQQQGIA